MPVFVSYFIEINKMNTVLCYKKLKADKNIAEPLSQVVNFKHIINAVLGFYDLISHNEHEVSQEGRSSGKRDLPTCVTILQKTIYI